MITLVVCLAVITVIAGIVLAIVFSKPKANSASIEPLENGDSSFGEILDNLRLSNSCGRTVK